MKRVLLGSVAALGLLAAATSPWAQEGVFRTTLNNYGGSGLLDMPSANQLPDGEFTLSVASHGPVLHTALTFQILPRVQGSFRYSGIAGLQLDGFSPDATYYDRSFDLRFKLLEEGRYLPDLTVGLQDFVGTGLYGAEYIVATKSLHPRLRVTAGLGWGRLGSQGAIASPLGPRPGGAGGTGGVPTFERWFRGPMAPFGGIEWQATDKIGFKLEYSSDAYTIERSALAAAPVDYQSPFNIGVEYQVARDFRLGLSWMHGSTLGLSLKMTNNPARPAIRGIEGAAPQPIPVRSNPRTNPQDWSTDWAESQPVRESLRDSLTDSLKSQGLVLESLVLRGDRAELRFRNPGIDAGAQAIGRAARAMAAGLPTSVEHFDIIPMVRGIPASMVRMRRSDLEGLEFAPRNAQELRARSTLADAPSLPADAMRGKGLYPDVTWALGPYATFELFDPRAPIRPEIGLRFKGAIELAPGLKLAGAAKYRLYGGLEGFTPLPFGESLAEYKVRSEAYRYEQTPFAIESLALSWHARPAKDTYSRISIGYLERHFAGASAEVLWKPVNSRFALGAEINYVQQRDPDSLLGMHPTYGPDVTGHLSAYYEFENGFLAQLDVGRYLARDVGATFRLEREFANGWRVGAFATLTDMPFSTFGEGAFDKGVTITIPLGWASGRPSRKDFGVNIRPVQRDGGAKLQVEDRLYGSIREYHAKRLDDQWGRVWR